MTLRQKPLDATNEQQGCLFRLTLEKTPTLDVEQQFEHHQVVQSEACGEPSSRSWKT